MFKVFKEWLSSLFAPRTNWILGYDDEADLAPELDMMDGTPLSAEISHLKVTALNALVDVVRVAGLESINWSTNRPDFWTVSEDGEFEQTAHESGSMNMDGTKVVIGGNMRAIWQGYGSGFKSADRLIIEVPESYFGSLTVDFAGVSIVRIGSWKGQSLELNSSSWGPVELGDISASESVIIDLKDSGDAEIGSIRGKSVEIDLRDGGSVTAESIVATRLAKINAFDSGDTEIDKLVCAELDVHVTGSGDVLIRSGGAKRGFVYTDDLGEVTLLGDFSNVSGEFSDEADEDDF